MSYTDYNDKRTPEERNEAYYQLLLKNNNKVIVNQDDIDSGMWNTVWKVRFDMTTFIVAADCESDALDEISDFLEWNAPQYFSQGLVYVPPEAPDDDELEDADHIGNYGYIVRDGVLDGITFTRVKRSFYATDPLDKKIFGLEHNPYPAYVCIFGDVDTKVDASISDADLFRDTDIRKVNVAWRSVPNEKMDTARSRKLFLEAYYGREIELISIEIRDSTFMVSKEQAIYRWNWKTHEDH